MAINYALLKTYLYDWAVSVVPLNMPVIYWQPNAPRPEVPYVTLFLNNILAVNQDWASGESDANGVIEMKGDRTFTLSIQAYGGEPLTVLENIRSSLQKQTVLDTLRVNGIAFFSSPAINDLSDLVDTQWERRGQMDVIFGVGQDYTDDPGYFDEIEVQEVILNPLGVIVHDETILITAP